MEATLKLSAYTYYIVLEWKEEMSEARRIILGAIFTPKHEHGFKLLRGQ